MSQADECLELDANLKMLKNYQRKQIRDFNGKRFFKDRRVAVLSRESRAMNGHAIKAFKLASAVLEYTRLEPRAGACDRRLFKAWNQWKEITSKSKLVEVQNSFVTNDEKLVRLKLRSISRIFLWRNVRPAFKKWSRATALMTESLKMRIEHAKREQNRRRNPSNIQRDKALRTQRGLLLLHNK